MSYHAGRDGHTAQTTCRLRRSATAITVHSLALKISHACRLRAKLAGAGQPIVLTVWGVGYRLLEAGGER
jgi:DNA-binding response OmpR family regulator